MTTATLNGTTLDYCSAANPEKPKKSYESKEVAEHQSDYFEKRFPGTPKQHAYKCPHGDHWHLTTRQPDEQYQAAEPVHHVHSVLHAAVVEGSAAKPTKKPGRLTRVETERRCAYLKANWQVGLRNMSELAGRFAREFAVSLDAATTFIGRHPEGIDNTTWGNPIPWSSREVTPQAVSLDSLDSEEHLLQAKLREIQAANSNSWMPSGSRSRFTTTVSRASALRRRATFSSCPSQRRKSWLSDLWTSSPSSGSSLPSWTITSPFSDSGSIYL
jgi:hypothetical protein